MIQDERKYGTCWTDLNIKDSHTGKIKWVSVLGYNTFALNYITIQFLVMTTFSMCFQAGLNAGIVTTIWAINPLFTALFDKILFGQSLATRHLVGVICLVFSAAAISLSGVFAE